MRNLIAVTTVASVLATTHVAAADPVQDFAFELKEYTGEYNRAWVLTKLTTFKVGKKCVAKLADKDNQALHTAAFYSRDIVEYAKAVTGDDWSRIEGQGNTERETNKKLVEPMMDAFRGKYSLTINVEGDDCDAKAGLWMKYWYAIGNAMKSYTPKGKITIVLNVTSKVKDLTATASGGTYTITAPRDIEIPAWTDKLEKPFRKAAKPL